MTDTSAEILFPEMSGKEGTTGVVVTWFVDDGAHVTPSTLVAEVAVDKVDAEVYPTTEGIIHIVVPEEAEVAQGAVIATIS